MKIVTLITVLAALLTACATPPPIQPPEVSLRDHPPLNVESTAELGETLLSKSRLFVFDGLELLERVTDNGFAREYIIEPSAMRRERVDADGNEFYSPPMDAYYVNDKTFRQKVRPRDAYVVRKKDGSLEMQGYFDFTTAGKMNPPNPRHKVGKIVDKRQPNFRQELIYGGRTGSLVRFTYREFSDDLIRPGFTQEAQYDLSSETTIGFKGVRIEVFAATNTKITYRVLRSFAPQP